MMRRHKRQQPTLNHDSEDDSPQPKKQLRSRSSLNTTISKNNHNETRKYRSDVNVKKNKGNRWYIDNTTVLTEESSSSGNEEITVQAKTRQRSVRALSDYESGNDNKATSSSASATRYNENEGRVSNSYSNILSSTRTNAFEESSSSDNEIILAPSRRGSMRALSDYETGDSSDKTVKNSRSSVNIVGQPSSSSSLVNEQYNFTSEDDNIVRVKRNKRSFNIISSSDSSDSEMPIKNQSLRKRMRIATSSEESDVETLNCASRSGRNNRRGRVNRRLESTGETINRRRSRRQQRSRPSRPSRGRRTTAPIVEDDLGSSESDVRSFRIRFHQDLTNVDRPNTRQRNRTENEIAPPVSRSRTCRTRRGPQLRSYNTSSSSDSENSLIYSNSRRRGAVLAIPESDTDESYSLQGERSTGVQLYDPSNATDASNPVRTVSRNSSDSDGESEKCTICLARFNMQEVGSPGSCDHSFCTQCILEWAKTSNTCPVDRKTFEDIIVRSHFEGEVIRQIKVEPPPPVNFWESDDLFEEVANIIVSLGGFSDYYESPSDELGELCMICNRDIQSASSIECDFCYNVFHMTCLNPPVSYIPVGDWYCPECANIEMVSSSSTSQSD